LSSTAGPDPVTHDLPGPTGESNRLTTLPRPPVLCLGPGRQASAEQAQAVRAAGGIAVEVPGLIPPGALTRLAGFSAAVWWGEATIARQLAGELAARPGAILPLVTGFPGPADCTFERHICIDTTAAGGNAALLAEAANP
jgi:RHH-type proline utilization regulon transcriptional repressor/proline dehydrogenase/delta 1-pyrroline-5-carboxylate dehydrogenase